MRDLSRYPITDGERIAVLEQLAKDLEAEGAIGDVRPLVLRDCAKFFRLLDGLAEDLRPIGGVDGADR